MATVVAGGKLKLDNGQVITPNEGGWYDGQFYKGGQIEGTRGTIGGVKVSDEVNAQSAALQNKTFPEFKNYLNQPVGTAPGVTTEGQPGAVTDTTGTSGVAVSSQEQTSMDAELKAAQDAIQKKTEEANKRMVENNANPFLSEGNRSGGEAKIRAALDNSLLADRQNVANIQARQKALQDKIAANKPNLDIQYQTDDSGNVNVITVDKNTGRIVSTVSAGKVGKASKGDSTTPTEQKSADKALITQTLQSRTNNYGHVDPAAFKAGLDAFIGSALGNREDYLNQFGNLIDPNRTDWGSAEGYGISADEKNRLLKLKTTTITY